MMCGDGAEPMGYDVHNWPTLTKPKGGDI